MDPKELFEDLRKKLPEGEKTECTIANKTIGLISITNKRLITYNGEQIKAYKFHEIVKIKTSLFNGVIKIDTITENIKISKIKAGNTTKFLNLLWSRIPADRKDIAFTEAIAAEAQKLDTMREKCLIDDINYNKKKQRLTNIATKPKSMHPKRALIMRITAVLGISLFSAAFVYSVYSIVSVGYVSTPMSEEKIAYYAAREFIGKQLKVPSSAEYDSYNESEVVKTIHDGGYEGYRVTMKVESENSFGAKIRSTFIVEINKVNENWVLVDLKESE